MVTNEELAQINNKICELREKKIRASTQSLADFLDGYIAGLKWVKNELG